MRPLEESQRAQALAARIEGIAGVLDPSGEIATGVLEGVSLAGQVHASARAQYVARDVRWFGGIPATADRIRGFQYVLLHKHSDERLVEITPNPPYFARRSMRRVREMAELGYYWGWDDQDEGWYFRGPGNPDVHDIRAPEEISQYDQICPRVPLPAD